MSNNSSSSALKSAKFISFQLSFTSLLNFRKAICRNSHESGHDDRCLMIVTYFLRAITCLEIFSFEASLPNSGTKKYDNANFLKSYTGY